MRKNRDGTPDFQAGSLCFFFTENFQIGDRGAFMLKMRDFVHKVRFKREKMDKLW